jgi:hypothetical protein
MKFQFRRSSQKKQNLCSLQAEEPAVQGAGTFWHMHLCLWYAYARHCRLCARAAFQCRSNLKTSRTRLEPTSTARRVMMSLVQTILSLPAGLLLKRQRLNQPESCSDFDSKQHTVLVSAPADNDTLCHTPALVCSGVPRKGHVLLLARQVHV